MGHPEPCASCDWYADGVPGCIAGRTVPPGPECNDFTPEGTTDLFAEPAQWAEPETLEDDPREPKEVA